MPDMQYETLNVTPQSQLETGRGEDRRKEQPNQRKEKGRASICNMTKAGDVLWAGSTTRTI